MTEGTEAPLSERSGKGAKKEKALIKNRSERGCGEEKGESEIIKGIITTFTIYCHLCSLNDEHDDHEYVAWR